MLHMCACNQTCLTCHYSTKPHHLTILNVGLKQNTAGSKPHGFTVLCFSLSYTVSDLSLTRFCPALLLAAGGVGSSVPTSSEGAQRLHGSSGNQTCSAENRHRGIC